MMLSSSQEKVHQKIKTGAETSGARGPGKQHGAYYRKRGSASYIVREVLSVRERERERERETEVTSPFSR